MTQQYMGRNNVTISMPEGGSVPIVSQTAIEPMKTALSRMFGAPHDDGAHRAAARAEAARAGRFVPARLLREWLVLHAVVGARRRRFAAGDESPRGAADLAKCARVTEIKMNCDQRAYAAKT
jgi:hypothetical protein